VERSKDGRIEEERKSRFLLNTHVLRATSGGKKGGKPEEVPKVMLKKYRPRRSSEQVDRSEGKNPPMKARRKPTRGEGVAW